MTTNTARGFQATLQRCARCQAGPRDVSGHGDLFMHAFIGTRMVLKCRACGTYWARSAGANGFDWEINGGMLGMRVPVAAHAS